jgi:hypothetical protein
MAATHTFAGTYPRVPGPGFIEDVACGVGFYGARNAADGAG